MSLYDGLGLDCKEKIQRDQKPDIMGWSSGIKLLQSQLQLKKAALTQAKREQMKRGGAVLAPVVDLKSRKDDSDDIPMVQMIGLGQKENKGNSTLLGGEWDVRQEYDPLWPNDYEKIMRDRADREKRIRDRERERDRERTRDRDRDRDRDRERDRDMERDRDYDDERPSRRNDGRERYNRRERHERSHEEEFEDDRPSRRAPNIGATIAPPPSLMDERKETPIPTTPFTTGSNVAARIMAKYGFREGQGLGKKEQGMSQALQVEKTSKRCGKIIHEKDIPKITEIRQPSPPPPPLPSTPPSSFSMSNSPPMGGAQVDSITEIMKNPSKVVLLRNMVGPGEVDEDLEPETKEECGKYGDVIRCVIFEIADGAPDDEAVRIFIEFKRMESAIKAVVDLNGRYFGGRVVKAGFYEMDKFNRLELV